MRNEHKEKLREVITKNRRLIIGLSVFLIVSGFIAHSLLTFINDANQSMYTHHSKQSVEHETIANHSNMSVLLLGTDKPSSDDGSVRTDSIILATFNNDKNVAKMVRIPRDLYISYHGYEGKINGVYEALGREELKQVVEDYTGVPITNTVTTDFDGLVDIVDSIGGINLYSDIEINDMNNSQVGNDIHINKGDVHLNGKEALAYSRIRYIDNDIKRGERQQQVLKAIADNILDASHLPQAKSNIQTIMKYVTTDISLSQVIQYIPKATDKPDISTISFDWQSFDVNGTSYVKLDDSEREKISQTLRKQLDIYSDKPLKSLKLSPIENETYQFTSNNKDEENDEDTDTLNNQDTQDNQNEDDTNQDDDSQDKSTYSSDNDTSQDINTNNEDSNQSTHSTDETTNHSTSLDENQQNDVSDAPFDNKSAYNSY